MVLEKHRKELFNGNIYDPTYKKDQLNIFKGKYLNLSYNNVLLFIDKISQKIYNNIDYTLNDIIEILNYQYEGETFEELNTFFNDLYINVNKGRFSSPKKSPLLMMYESNEISDEQFISTVVNERIFDHLDDFDLIYSIFLEKYRIDLIEDNINWYTYTSLLENILLGENSLTKRISFRTYKQGSVKENEEYYINNKEKYSLVEVI